MTGPKIDYGKLNDQYGQNGSREEWLANEPEPLGCNRNLPDFPVEVLPEPYAGMVLAVAEFTQTNVSMVGTSVISVLAACCGGRVQVEVQPGWLEPTNVFTATVALPGERKSAVQAVLTAPLMAAERELMDKAGPLIREALTMRDIEDKSMGKAIMAAAGLKATDEQRSEAIAAAMRAEAITVPALPRILADDITPEAAASLLAEHGRLAIISAEGGIFDIIAGRYSNNIPNLDVWLKGHAGDRLKVDRKGRPAEYVEQPALTVGVMIQYAVFTAIARSPVMRGRGLMARFLYSLPTSRVGYRRSDPPPVPPELKIAYEKNVHDLAASLAEWADPAVILLDQGAVAVLRQFQDYVEPRMRPGWDLAHIADWTNKAPGAAVSLAGLLHLAKDPDGWRNSITAPTMAAAVTLTNYFIEHALAAFDAMSADPVIADAVLIMDAVIGRDLDEFSVRDLHRSIIRSRFTAADGAGPALLLLVQTGWIRRKHVEPKATGQRPSPVFEVHPKASTSAQNAQNAQNP